MGIYLGNTKITGTGVQIDNALSSTSQHSVTNAAITNALNEVGYSEWQKPSDWIDIRSGALPNSVYYLVGHSADYTTYPIFAVYVEIPSSGTYDVYVDGVKKASAVASGTTTTLTWQTLALETGYNTTYPQALRTHIVRVTPTDSTKNISRIGGDGSPAGARAGLLWVHFTTNNYLQIRYVGQSAPLLEAVTCNGDSLKISNAYAAFQGATSLKEIPTLEGNNTSVSLYSMCQGNESLKQIKVKNLTSSTGTYMFNNCTSLKHIYCDNALLFMGNNTFNGCESLEELPPLDVTSSTTGNVFIKGCVSLNNTFLDVQQATGLTRLDVSGTSSARVDGLKGLLVSNEATFTGSSPQLNVSYTGMDRAALVNLFNSLPTVSASQVCNVTGATGANDLTASDLAIATAKGWTVTR